MSLQFSSFIQLHVYLWWSVQKRTNFFSFQILVWEVYFSKCSSLSVDSTNVFHISIESFQRGIPEEKLWKLFSFSCTLIDIINKYWLRTNKRRAFVVVFLWKVVFVWTCSSWNGCHATFREITNERVFFPWYDKQIYRSN